MSNETTTVNFMRTYVAPQIATTLVTSPRFGHTNDITALISSNDADVDDYRAGLIAAASITAICFFCVMICIPILMCCGQSRVGFLSGAPMKSRSNSSSSSGPGGGSNNKDEQSTGMNSFGDSVVSRNNKQTQVSATAPQQPACCGEVSPTLIRCIFILSGIIFILFAILIVTQGITNLQDTIVGVHQSAVDIDSIATEADDIINSGVLNIQGTATSVRDGIVNELSGDNFCPADPTLENNEAAANIRTQADNAVQLLTMLDNFLGDQVNAVASAIDQVAKGARQVENSTDDIDLTDWEALLVLIPYTIVPCLLVAAVIMAQFDVQFPFLNTAINWFLMPLFVIMVIVCVGVASGMIAAASANSDFCLPGGRPELDSYPGTSPDTTVYRVLDRKGYDQSGLVRQVAEYYVEQCQNATDPFEFLKSYIPTLSDSQVTLNELSESIKNDEVLVQLSLYCNREYDNVDALLTEMNDIINVLLETIERTVDLISCERIVPIYHRSIYDATCQYSVSAVFWIFSGALIMGFFGLLMILFRSAYKPTIYDDSIGVSNNRNSNHVEPELVEYDDGHVGSQYSPKAQQQQSRSTPYNYTPPRRSYFSNSSKPVSSNHQEDYSPNKSSIYMDDSPGRNASYY